MRDSEYEAVARHPCTSEQHNATLQWIVDEYGRAVLSPAEPDRKGARCTIRPGHCDTLASHHDPTATGTADLAIEPWLRAVAAPSEPFDFADAPSWTSGTHIGAGRFVMGTRLGSGGMGVVYEAYDLERATTVALKTLFDRSVERFVAFKHEFRVLQGVHHENLVTLGELFEDQNRWFFTMERVDGVDFTKYVRTRGLSEQRLRACLAQLVEGLIALHRAGKIHRDVKPSNTLVQSDGRVVLLDFGLVTDANAGRSDFGVGTWNYMAPEQAGGWAGPAADWYSLGVMLYEALTTELPFNGAGPSEVDQVPVPPSKRSAVPIPSDLETLCLELLNRYPQHRPNGSDIQRRLRGDTGLHGLRVRESRTARDATAFIGRDAELAHLHELLRRSLTHTPATGVVVLGDSGMGKTTLLKHFKHQIADDALVFAGRCYEHEYIPFKALDGVMDALAETLNRLPASERAMIEPRGFANLAKLFGVLGRVIPHEDRMAADARAQRTAGVVALGDILSQLAARQPIVIMIDDLQWADRDSLVLLEELLRPDNAPRVLLVLAARQDTELPKLLKMSAITLAPLSSESAVALAKWWVEASPERSLDPEVIARAAGGHPMLIEVIAQHTDPSAQGPTANLLSAMLGRLEALDESARATMQFVSLAAQPIPKDVLARCSGLEPELFTRLLRRLQAARVLRAHPKDDQLVVEPYHDSIRLAAAHLLTVDQASSRHRTLALALEELAPDREEMLAVHWHAAGDGERALPYVLNTAARAEGSLAFERAAALYARALELTYAGEPRKGSILERRGRCLAKAGRGIDAANEYQAAAALTPGKKNWELRHRAADQLLEAGRVEDGLAAIDALLPSVGMRRAGTRVGATVALASERLRAACEHWIPMPRPRDAANLARRVDVCWSISLGLSQVDPFAGAAFQLRHLRLARRLREPRRIALGLCLQAVPSAAVGRPAARSRQLLAEAEKIMQRSCDPHVEAFHALCTAIVDFVTGNWSDALRNGERALPHLQQRRVGGAWELATTRQIILDSLWRMGRLSELEYRTRQIVADARSCGDEYAAVQLETTVLPIVHLKKDEPDFARALRHRANEEMLGPLQRWQMHAWLTLIELYDGNARSAMRAVTAPMNRLDWLLLSRFHTIRVFSRFLRASAALGVAALEEPDAWQFRCRAKRDFVKLEREKPACGSIALLRAQLAAMDGDCKRALELLSEAKEKFVAKQMLLFVAVATYAEGLVSSEAKQAESQMRAKSWMQAQGVRRPDKLVAMLAPAFNGALLARV